jgi:hypothetical protein
MASLLDTLFPAAVVDANPLVKQASEYCQTLTPEEVGRMVVWAYTAFTQGNAVFETNYLESITDSLADRLERKHQQDLQAERDRLEAQYEADTDALKKKIAHVDALVAARTQALESSHQREVKSLQEAMAQLVNTNSVRAELDRVRAELDAVRTSTSVRRGQQGERDVACALALALPEYAVEPCGKTPHSGDVHIVEPSSGRRIMVEIKNKKAGVTAADQRKFQVDISRLMDVMPGKIVGAVMVSVASADGAAVHIVKTDFARTGTVPVLELAATGSGDGFDAAAQIVHMFCAAAFRLDDLTVAAVQATAAAQSAAAAGAESDEAVAAAAAAAAAEERRLKLMHAVHDIYTTLARQMVTHRESARKLFTGLETTVGKFIELQTILLDLMN